MALKNLKSRVIILIIVKYFPKVFLLSWNITPFEYIFKTEKHFLHEQSKLSTKKGIKYSYSNPKWAIHRKNLSNVVLAILQWVLYYSKTLNKEYIGRIYQMSSWQFFNEFYTTVKPLIKNTSKEFIKCRILHFLIMECCRYLVF